MKKRLFMVDYRENGESKHHAIEIGYIGDATDMDMVTACHEYVGRNTVLDSVIEVFADMTAEELNEISQSPACISLPKKPLYINIAEALRMGREMKENRR